MYNSKNTLQHVLLKHVKEEEEKKVVALKKAYRLHSTNKNSKRKTNSTTEIRTRYNPQTRKQ